MLLDGLLATREAVLVDLVLDLRRRVGHVDARVRVRRAHLRLRALQRREELGVQQCRLRVLQLRRDVSREAEVRILVDRAWDEAWDVRLGAEDLGEGVREGWRGLDGREVDFPNVIPVRKTLKISVCACSDG